MTHARLPLPNEQVLFTEIGDGSAVLLHLDTKFYYTLNPTGVVVWKSIVEGKLPTVAAIGARLVAEFRVEAEAAERDVAKIVGELVADGLVLPRPLEAK
jgi:hypothetical protein